MAIYTKTEKAEELKIWKEAARRCASGQEYAIGTRRLTRVDLPEIRKHLDWLDSQATTEDEASGGGSPCFIQCIPGRGAR